MTCGEEGNEGRLTLVRTTISSRGRLSCLIAFPRMTSDSPLEYTGAVSNVWMPQSYLQRDPTRINAWTCCVANFGRERIVERTYAYLMCLKASCSSEMSHGCHSVEPKVMHPRMIRDTFKPEFPRRTINRCQLHSVIRFGKE